jgi:DNA polymerase
MAGDPIPDIILEAAADPGEFTFYAWNASYDWRCLPVAGWPAVPYSQFIDCAALAAQLGLPRALENCAKVLGLEYQKDVAGRATMLRMAQNPGKKHPPEDWVALRAYNRFDLLPMREFFFRFQGYQSTATERQTELLNQVVNDRGLAADAGLAEACVAVVKRLRPFADARVVELTDGFVSTVGQRDKILEWLRLKGFPLDNLRSKTIEETLEEDLEPVVRELLLTRLNGSKMAASKMAALLKGLSADGRIRDTLRYWGASATGRWTGSGVQPQNLRKSSLPVEVAVERLRVHGAPGPIVRRAA